MKRYQDCLKTENQERPTVFSVLKEVDEKSLRKFLKMEEVLLQHIPDPSVQNSSYSPVFA